MSVDRDTVKGIAKLARIALDEARCEPMVKELNAILAWVEQLKEVEITDIAPLTSVVAQTLKMRNDVVTDGGNAAALMSNAPQAEDDYFVVPKVVE